MTKLVTIVDYGIGNIFSVTRAFQRCGADVLLTDKPEDILAASSLVLPGVGAFSNGMAGLRERGLINPLKAYAASGKPLLGICLGMQMLFSSSSEFGEQSGLNIIEGKILAIEPAGPEGLPLKVPHIGWSELKPTEAGPQWETSILKHLNGDTHSYFVHSFTAFPDDERHRLADTYYGSSQISAVVAKGNVYGCQFHPEKSGAIGLKIIDGFLEI
jgi:glutamine amidotransferase